MINLSQRDPRWSNAKLGQSSLRVGRFGCTTTCISMLSDYFKSFVTPLDLATKVLKYTNDGLILWPSVNNIKNMAFEKRWYGRNDVEIQNALKDPNKAVIFEVESHHWVVGLSKVFLVNKYFISDPFYGDRTTSDRYKSITGFTTFVRK